MKIIPKQVVHLRSELERLKFKPGKARLNRMIAMHRRLIGDELIFNKAVYYNDTIIASCFRQVVFGGHGPYVELAKSDFICDLEITKGQEWRNTEKYKYVKYIWMNPVGIDDLKVYLQKNTVTYANYVPGFYYIDYWSVDLRGL